MIVYDQIEVEQSYIYSGSMLNDLYLEPTNVQYANSTIKITNNFTVSGVLNYNSLFRPLVGSIANGLSGTIGGYTYGNSMVIGNYNPTTTNETNFYNSYFSSSNVLTFGDAYNFINKNYSSTTKRLLKLVSQDETIYDSIMPDPQEIYSSGTIDTTRQVPLFIYHLQSAQPVNASFMMLCYNIVTNSFSYYDFEAGTANVTSQYPNNFNVSPIDDQIFLGNYVWPFQFPFQKEYKNINRKVTSLAAIKHTTASNMYLDQEEYKSISYSFDRDIVDLIGDYSIFGPTSISTQRRDYPLSIVYGGKDNVNIQDTNTYTDNTRITKSLCFVVDLPINNTSSIDYSVGQKIIAPSTNTLLFHFYSFGDLMGKFANGLRSTNATTGASGINNFWNHPGFANILIDYNTSASNDIYRFRILTGSLIGYDCRGYKFGVYKPIPDYSYCIFRPNKFGQVRDMLEQRLYTKFYNSNTEFGSVVSVLFSTTSSYGITASNSYLNLKDSGIYDYEYKCGQPFFDTDERII